MKTLTLTVVALGLVFSISAQSKKKKDAEAIKEMCGCFEVTFNFAETFNYTSDSLYNPSKNKVSKALEWAQLVTDDKDKISIQHILQMGNPADPYVMKHWRQDWIYENQDFYMYNGNNNWIYIRKSKKDIKKQWTQKVYQVDDSPRYEGSGTWVHLNGKSYWESTTTAPLPRREYTQRNDYNITMRGNRHQITDAGWFHDQDNSKILRTDGKDSLIANEKGYNIYKKVADSRCSVAQEWWTKHTGKWQSVRNKWDEVFSRNIDLSLEAKVDNKPLYKHLFSDDITKEDEMNTIIESFVKK